MAPQNARDIVAMGDAAVPALIDVLLTDILAAEDAPGQGYAPIHAARLLAELRAEAAVAPMLQLLRTTHWNDLLRNEVLLSLPRIGAPVLEPALRAYQGSDDIEFRSCVASVLAETGVRDERVFELLVGRLGVEREAAAMCLTTYGDARAIDHLSRAFDAFRLERRNHLLANQALIEIRAAIEGLRGALTPEQEAKYTVALDVRMRLRELTGSHAEPITRRERPGRNDPCWCGSTKKDKRCHLDDDERDARIEP